MTPKQWIFEVVGRTGHYQRRKPSCPCHHCWCLYPKVKVTPKSNLALLNHNWDHHTAALELYPLLGMYQDINHPMVGSIVKLWHVRLKKCLKLTSPASLYRSRTCWLFTVNLQQWLLYDSWKERGGFSIIEHSKSLFINKWLVGSPQTKTKYTAVCVHEEVNKGTLSYYTSKLWDIQELFLS